MGFPDGFSEAVFFRGEHGHWSKGTYAMPTYTYECTSCGHEQAVFHAITAAPRVKCASCGGKTKKLLGTGAGIIFKGSGFYETDFKEKKGKPPAESGKSGTKGEGKAESKAASDTKSAGDKPAAKPAKSAGKTAAASH